MASTWRTPTWRTPGTGTNFRKRRENWSQSPRQAARRAFTLVELLVVISIIAILLTMLNPMAYRAKARESICLNNLRVLGVGWQSYWLLYGYRTPNQFNVIQMDCIGQFNFMTYCGREHTTGTPDYVNAGILYKYILVPSEMVYCCPTYEGNYGSPWYNDGSYGKHSNNWLPQKPSGSYMTYSTRRMLRYDDSTVANLGPMANQKNEVEWQTRGDKDIMIFHAGVSKALGSTPETYSFMADRIDSAANAMMSHVPGVNVLWLDGHASFWKDPTWDGTTGRVLYDNGIGGWGQPWNWVSDDLWMIIDGYHQPPVGQGQ